MFSRIQIRMFSQNPQLHASICTLYESLPLCWQPCDLRWVTIKKRLRHVMLPRTTSPGSHPHNGAVICRDRDVGWLVNFARISTYISLSCDIVIQPNNSYSFNPSWSSCRRPSRGPPSFSLHTLFGTARLAHTKMASSSSPATPLL